MSGDGVLFLVPARGGSVRVPGKNLRLVAGMPLVARAVRAARLAATAVPGGPHAVVCSTDDPEIAEVARTWGGEVPFVRPASLATATATSVDVALHALDALAAAGRTFRALVLVQPTSPLTDPADLVAGVAAFDADGRPVVAVTAAHPATFHVATAAEGATITPLAGDDALAADRMLAGAFYVTGVADLRRTGRLTVPGATRGLEIPAERAVDVDEEADLVVAEAFAMARPVRAIAIAGHAIGAGPVFVIAEGGVNHGGDPALAHRLVDAAADAGADAVKFQTFDPDTLAAAGAPMADYQVASGERGHDQREMLARLTLPRDAWAGLQRHARERGLVFLSTPFDAGSAALLDALDVPAFKIGSGELTNLPFIELVAGFGRPMLLSTGMADMREVAEAMDALRAAGDPPVALFHCVSSYPAAPGDANLRAIATLRAAFAVPAGWSDHTPGIELPMAAVAMGAAMVEKHLTLDRTMAGPDHASSLEPGEFGAMTAAIRAVEAAIGTGDKRPVAAEVAVAAVARRSLHWTRDAAAGSVVETADVVALRPATGISPARLRGVLGRRTVRAVSAGTPVLPGDLEADR